MAIDQTTLNMLRRAIDERIPPGGSDTDTEYTDAELVAYLEDSKGNINATASVIWLEKASSLAPSAGGIKSYTVAGESYTMEGAQSAYQHALAMYELYKGRSSGAMLLLSAEPLEERNTCDNRFDISRLTQDKAGW